MQTFAEQIKSFVINSASKSIMVKTFLFKGNFT